MHSTSAGTDLELAGGGSGGWSCMLLLHPVLNCADAGPDLCTLHPDLCTLCLQWLPLAATYGGGVSSVDFGTQTTLVPTVVSPIATCIGGVFLPPTDADAGLTLGQLHCVVV